MATGVGKVTFLRGLCSHCNVIPAFYLTTTYTWAENNWNLSIGSRKMVREEMSGYDQDTHAHTHTPFKE